MKSKSKNRVNVLQPILSHILISFSFMYIWLCCCTLVDIECLWLTVADTGLDTRLRRGLPLRSRSGSASSINERFGFLLVESGSEFSIWFICPRPSLVAVSTASSSSPSTCSCSSPSEDSDALPVSLSTTSLTDNESSSSVNRLWISLMVSGESRSEPPIVCSVTGVSCLLYVSIALEQLRWIAWFRKASKDLKRRNCREIMWTDRFFWPFDALVMCVKTPHQGLTS